MGTLTVNPERVVSPEEASALVTIEVAERLAARAFRHLVEEETPSKETLAKVQDLLLAISVEAGIRTCTAVKSLALSDQIAAEARATVRDIVTKVEAR